jgi:hypothetical protein
VPAAPAAWAVAELGTRKAPAATKATSRYRNPTTQRYTLPGRPIKPAPGTTGLAWGPFGALATYGNS